MNVSIWHREAEQTSTFFGLYIDGKICSEMPGVYLQRNRSEENYFGMPFADSIRTDISHNTHQEE